MGLKATVLTDQFNKSTVAPFYSGGKLDQKGQEILQKNRILHTDTLIFPVFILYKTSHTLKIYTEIHLQDTHASSPRQQYVILWRI